MSPKAHMKSVTLSRGVIDNMGFLVLLWVANQFV